MDNECLIKLSKFSVLARKVIGPVNAAKMIKDSSYGLDVFQKVDELGDEALILLSLDLQSMLGMLEKTPEVKKTATKDKYLYGARG